jgi:choice-of-anchor C domain-containing protein
MKLLVKGSALTVCVLSAAMVLGNPGAAKADSILLNGSFESGYPDPGQFLAVNAGGTAIDGWQVGASGVDYIGTYWTAQDGARSIDLNAMDVGSISQTFATAINQVYRVTFWLSGNPAASQPDPRTGTVTAGAGSQTFSFTLSSSGARLGDMKWVKQSFDFIATSAMTTLEFSSTTIGPSNVGGYEHAFGPALDNVAVVAVPTPSAVAAGMGMLGILGAARFLRRRQAGI